jgi:hypothetical protein
MEASGASRSFLAVFRSPDGEPILCNQRAWHVLEKPARP